jgi:hypothetical protein
MTTKREGAESIVNRTIQAIRRSWVSYDRVRGKEREEQTCVTLLTLQRRGAERKPSGERRNKVRGGHVRREYQMKITAGLD